MFGWIITVDECGGKWYGCWSEKVKVIDVTYKMFLDDERMPVKDEYVIVRSFEEAVAYMKANGLPEFITFDHDLGGFRNGFHVADWIVCYCLDNDIHVLPKWEVHSQNPVGAENIKKLLNRAAECI